MGRAVPVQYLGERKGGARGNMTLGRWVLFLCMAASLLGCPSRLRYLHQPVLIEATGAYTHADSGMTFPQVVADFRRSRVLRYDTQGSDVSVGYDLYDPPRLVEVTVYVYPAPSPVVAIGSPPEVVAPARAALAKSEFEARKREILQAHPGAILVEEKEVSLPQGGGAYSGRMATFDYEGVFAFHSQLLRSRVYLFNYVGGKWAIKYRFAHPKKFDATKEIEAFMQNFQWTVASS